MWQVANTLLVSGTASLVLGCVIAALFGFVMSREGIADSATFGIAWTIGIFMAAIVLGGGFLMTVTGLALMWTTKWDDGEEEQIESEEMEDELCPGRILLEVPPSPASGSL